MEIIWFLIIGILSGWIAGELVRGHGYGLIGNLIVGIIGALLGGYILTWFGVAAGGLLGRIVASVLGAVIFLFILSLIPRGVAR